MNIYFYKGHFELILGIYKFTLIDSCQS